tara:strand:- start:11838 stop:12101 length:264 start_codon:yes stop_codon:yes gene_type:complete
MKKQKQKIEITPKSSEPYKKGDFCYYIAFDSKVYLGEIQSVEASKDLIYTLVDQQTYKFGVVAHEKCFDDEKKAKLFAKNLKKEKKQ